MMGEISWDPKRRRSWASSMKSHFNESKYNRALSPTLFSHSLYVLQRFSLLTYCMYFVHYLNYISMFGLMKLNAFRECTEWNWAPMEKTANELSPFGQNFNPKFKKIYIRNLLPREHEMEKNLTLLSLYIFFPILLWVSPWTLLHYYFQTFYPLSPDITLM